MAIRLESKRVGEVRDYSYDWSAFLVDDTIATSDVTVSGATLDSDTNDTTSITVWLSGGVVGVPAVITNTIVTVAGRTETEVFTVNIVAEDEPISLADAKAQVRVNDTSQDAYIHSLIPAARRYVEKRSGIILKRRQFVEWAHPRYGAMALTKAPLVSIDSIAYTDSNEVASTYTGARFFPGSSIIFPALGESWPTPYVGESFEVTYTAGLSAAQLASEDYDGLLHAMKLLIGHWFKNREAVSGPDGSHGEVPIGVNSLCDQERAVIV